MCTRLSFLLPCSRVWDRGYVHTCSYYRLHTVIYKCQPHLNAPLVLTPGQTRVMEVNARAYIRGNAVLPTENGQTLLYTQGFCMHVSYRYCKVFHFLLMQIYLVVVLLMTFDLVVCVQPQGVFHNSYFSTF